MNPFFRYTKSQKRGVFFLILLIIGIQLVYYFYNFNDQNEPSSVTAETLALQRQVDALKLIAEQPEKTVIYPFNPNYITDFKGYQLGLSIDEIDRLLAFRKSGKFVNSAEEFQEITKIADSLLDSLSPYFKFPDWVNHKKSINIGLKTTAKLPQKEVQVIKPAIQDLNLATEEDLVKIKGIGSKLAGRIIKYRTRLKGFSVNEQLYEVYYLDKEIADRALQRFQVLAKPTIKKLNVNTATFKEILAIPYIDYELTKKIFNYRDMVAEIQQLDELKQIEGFPLEKFDRIALYLEAR